MPKTYDPNKGQVVKMRPRPAIKAVKTPVEPQDESKNKETKAESRGKKEKNSNSNNFDLNTFMEKTMSKQNKAFDSFAKDAGDMTREYSDALMKSGTILMKGYENIMGVVMSMVQTSTEKQARLMKEAMSSKTINEFAEIQNKIAQASFDDFMSSATKISEIGVKVLTESSEPVNAQVTRAIQKATEAMAA